MYEMHEPCIGLILFFPLSYLLGYDIVSDNANDHETFECESTFPTTAQLFGEDTLTQIDGERHATARYASTGVQTGPLSVLFPSRC